MDAKTLLVAGLRASGSAVERMAGDLSPGDMLHRPCKGANCAAWIIGHLTLAERRMMTTLGVADSDLPPLPDDFQSRFTQKEDGPTREDYGDTTNLLDLLGSHFELFAKTVEEADVTVYERPISHPMFDTIGKMVAFAPIHRGLHAGHLSTIRRSLGRPALF